MTEEKKSILKKRARTILSAFTGLIEEHGGLHHIESAFSGHGGEQAGAAGHQAVVRRVTAYAAGEDRELTGDRYTIRFVFDAARTVAERPWETQSDIYDLLPLYGFRRNEEVLQWAHWFGSHRKRMLSVNVFIRDIQSIQIRKSVNDMMFETFRAEQKAIASRVIRYLADDAHWE